MKILIVDDKKEELYLLETLLKGHGFQVFPATNGAEALEKLRADGFDMVISDILMPVMDGFQLCHECKKDKKLKNIPFVFYTATYLDQKDEELALALGADKFIRKPVDVDEFLDIIRGVAREVQAGKPVRRKPVPRREEEILKLYSERLVNKLEKKVLELQAEVAKRQKAEEDLRTSEEMYRAIVNQSLLGIAVGQDFRIVLANAAFAQIFGYSVDELLSLPPDKALTLIHPEDQALVLGRFRDRVAGNPVPARYDFRGIRKDGTVRWLEANASRIKYAGKPAVQTAIIDITEKKRAEEQAQHLNLLLRAIRDIDQLVAKGTDRDSLLKGTCQILAETRGYYGAWIAILDELGKLVTAAEVGLGNRFQHLVQRLERGDLVCCAREALAKPSVVVIKDTSLECADCPIAMEREVRGAMSVRLEYGGNVHGLMTVIVPTGVTADQEERTLFEEVAGDIAFALHSIQQEEERRRAEEKLRRNEERFRALIENLSDVVVVADSLGMVQYYSPNYKAVWRRDPSGEVGADIFRYVHPADVALVREKFDCILKSPEGMVNFEVRAQDADGSWHIIEVVGRNLLDNPAVRGIVANFRDITERRHLEEALRRSEERYRTILEEMEDGYYEADLSGHLTFVNNATCRVLGRSKEELIGMSYKKFISDDIIKPVFQAFSQVYQTGMLNRSIPWKIIRKDGTIRFVEASAFPMLNDKGEIIGFRGVGRDITERRKMEEQLMLTDRLASVGQLAAGIAHELNNPLTGVIGFADLLLERDLPADIKADLETVNREAKRAVNIVKGLLAFAREQTTEKTLLNINTIIQGVLQIRSYEQRVSNIEVDACFAQALPLVRGNGVQLQQVFINIIVNAEQAMLGAHGRGKLTIVTEQVGDVVRASITDDGPGISPDNMKRLFTPFFTTREVGKGTGLGLSICHGIVTEHGGKIWAESEFGKGATFVVELPVSK